MLPQSPAHQQPVWRQSRSPSQLQREGEKQSLAGGAEWASWAGHPQLTVWAPGRRNPRERQQGRKKQQQRPRLLPALLLLLARPLQLPLPQSASGVSAPLSVAPLLLMARMPPSAVPDSVVPPLPRPPFLPPTSAALLPCLAPSHSAVRPERRAHAADGGCYPCDLPLREKETSALAAEQRGARGGRRGRGTSPWRRRGGR